MIILNRELDGKRLNRVEKDRKREQEKEDNGVERKDGRLKIGFRISI